MNKMILVAIGIAAPLSAAEAQNMSVAEFLGKADALQEKGPMALFSSDLGKLKAEIQKSGKALRVEQEKAVKAGQEPQTCMPAKASTDAKELLAYFRAIPAPLRRMTVKEGFAGLVRKKYPCPGSS